MDIDIFQETNCHGCKREKIACRVSTELHQWDNLAFNILEIIASYSSLLV